VSKSNPRVLTALARFLSVLDAAGATLHLPIARRFELRVEGSGEIVDGRLTDEIEDLEALVGMRCVASLWVVTLARPGKEQRAYYLTGIRAAPADGAHR
jgi:hypothetical protein